MGMMPCEPPIDKESGTDRSKVPHLQLHWWWSAHGVTFGSGKAPGNRPDTPSLGFQSAWAARNSALVL